MRQNLSYTGPTLDIYGVTNVSAQEAHIPGKDEEEESIVERKRISLREGYLSSTSSGQSHRHEERR